jgi:RHS repeat-associated protein
LSPEKQPYKFGGKELDEMYGLNWYDFEARQYDGIVPRFTTMDPLAEKYYSVSPYAYCANNPVNAIDSDGKKVIFITKIAGKITHFEYTSQGNLKNVNTGQIYNGNTVGGHLGKIVDGYNKMLTSGDANYIKQVTTLINSDNVHEIDATIYSGAGGEVTPGSGITTTDEAKAKASKGEGIGTNIKYNFSENELSSGLEKTNYTTVAHEVQHQYDFDQGKMKDSFDKKGDLIKGGKSPAEKRAIKNEDIARDQEKLERRKKY